MEADEDDRECRLGRDEISLHRTIVLLLLLKICDLVDRSTDAKTNNFGIRSHTDSDGQNSSLLLPTLIHAKILFCSTTQSAHESDLDI